MRVLIIGSGGREHAIGWKLKESSKVDKIFFAPGNAGTKALGENVDIAVDDIDGLLSFAKAKDINLTVVGPELPLSLGVVDRFNRAELKIFGPDKNGALLETSKVYSKEFMQRYDIPTARYESYSTINTALEALKGWDMPMVIKADGLAAGKGVYICNNANDARVALKEIMEDKIFGASGSSVIFEEFLVGKEVSLLCFVDNNTIIPMESAADYKAVGNGDTGANTGGMGCISPVGYYDKKDIQPILDNTLKGIKAEGFDYRGVLFIGLMQTASGTKVLEYNVRFGDPETEVIMPRLQSDLASIIEQVIDGKLKEANISWSSKPCLTVVMASGGYPDKYTTDYPVMGLDDVKDSIVFHGGTKNKGEEIVTAGGRVLMVSSLGESINEAREKSYSSVKKINFKNAYYRIDIGDPKRGI